MRKKLQSCQLQKVLNKEEEKKTNDVKRRKIYNVDKVMMSSQKVSYEKEATIMSPAKSLE